VSENDVTLTLNLNSSLVKADIENLRKQAEAVTKEWAQERRAIIMSVQQTISYINRAVSMYRQVLQLMDANIDPFFSALLGMVTSTVSMMLSVATALTSSIVGAPLGAYVGAIAIGLNIATTAKLMRDKMESERYTRQAITRVNDLRARFTAVTSPFGAGF